MAVRQKAAVHAQQQELKGACKENLITLDIIKTNINSNKKWPQQARITKLCVPSMAQHMGKTGT